MKKFTLILICFLLIGCVKSQNVSNNIEMDRFKIVCTLFPQYDIAKKIAGEYADVSMLLLPGVDSHFFDPTPHDTLYAKNADLFFYTGADKEVWSQKFINGFDGD